jgi:GntR family transcriptional regulator, sialic acid-inducible nan operon repressor
MAPSDGPAPQEVRKAKGIDMQKLGAETAGSERIVRRKLSDQVLERLLEMIMRGEVKPGELMPSERDLMDRFCVGRPAVREALQSLDTMGLIGISHGERARVSALSAETAFRQIDGVARLLLSSSPDNLAHLKQARRFFEIGMVQMAAANAAPGDIAELRELIERQRESLGSAEAFISADIGFHRKIAALSCNPIFVAVCDAMLNWLFNYHVDLLIWSGAEQKTLAEHAVIVDCLAEADARGAADAMGIHLDRSDTLYRHRDDRLKL